MKESDKKFLAILVFAVSAFIGTLIACEMLDSQHEPIYGMSMHGPANISAGNNIAIFTAGTFEWNQSIIKDLEYNRSFHIPENATENWTIWKGDRVVCYIPK